MGPLALSVLGFTAVLVLAALRVPLALALGLVGAIGTGYIKGWNTFIYVAGSAPFEVLNNYGLSVLPLFIVMGAFAVRTGLAADLVRVANGFMGHYPGGLAMSGVTACAGFGSVCGSDMATLSTMSKITVPEMLRRGYSVRLAGGSLAAGGTLGILIPPSVPMVIYATMTESSIGRMFAGGIVPGIVLTVMFVIAIGIWASLFPAAAPRSERLPWMARIALLKDIVGVSVVFILMLGGMYAGFFSPTEGAAAGAAGVLLVGVIQRRLSWTGFVESVREAVQLSAIIFLILIGIALFHFYMDSVELQKTVTSYLAQLDMSPAAVMAIILIGLILLGCVMDSTSILFITTPFLFPIVVGLGFDAIWFGVVMVMVIQLGLIHPPFGLNVFVLSAMIREITVAEAFWGCVPFVIANILIIVLVCIYPGIITWLPNMMFN
ncbi:MAG: TRAP transporter large permease [Betaproteobacteria bacterium]|nr:TRAP transporter large permease [Betaproteobacteria bacterium]